MALSVRYSIDQTVPARFIPKDRWQAITSTQDAHYVLSLLSTACDSVGIVASKPALVAAAKSGDFEHLLEFVGSLVEHCGCSMSAYRQRMKLFPAEKGTEKHVLTSSGVVSSANSGVTFSTSGVSQTLLANGSMVVMQPGVYVTNLASVPVGAGLSLSPDGTIEEADEE